MCLESGNTNDALDSWQHVGCRRRNEEYGNVAIRFTNKNVGNGGLFRLHAAAHGYVRGVTDPAESEDTHSKTLLVEDNSGHPRIHDEPKRMALNLNFENGASQEQVAGDDGNLAHRRMEGDFVGVKVDA